MKLYCKLCKYMNTSQKLKKVKLIVTLACDHLSPEYLDSTFEPRIHRISLSRLFHRFFPSFWSSYVRLLTGN